MTQATKIKLQKAQPTRSDSIEFEVRQSKIMTAPKLKRGYKYRDSINVLITFEGEKREKAFKVMNNENKSYTAVINDSLDLLLYCRGLITFNDILSEEIRSLIFEKNYKPLKHKKTKQK